MVLHSTLRKTSNAPTGGKAASKCRFRLIVFGVCAPKKPKHKESRVHRKKMRTCRCRCMWRATSIKEWIKFNSANAYEKWLISNETRKMFRVIGKKPYAIACTSRECGKYLHFNMLNAAFAVYYFVFNANIKSILRSNPQKYRFNWRWVFTARCACAHSLTQIRGNINFTCRFFLYLSLCFNSV